MKMHVNSPLVLRHPHPAPPPSPPGPTTKPVAMGSGRYGTREQRLTEENYQNLNTSIIHIE